jgi:phosphoribosylamine--glycine ligase
LNPRLINRRREMANPVAGILMGSDSDLEVMEKCAEVLRVFGIPHEMSIASAHRSPERVRKYAREAKDRGLKVIIAGAGGAAHLAGVIASHTEIAVIGVPLASGPLQGIDALLSTVQMPAGVPVACVGVGEPGARNAAVLAARILALEDRKLAYRLREYQKALVKGVEEKDRRLKARSKAKAKKPARPGRKKKKK